MSKNIYVIWIDENIDNEEYTKYKTELEKYCFLKCYKVIEDGINFIKNDKYVKFQETNIIISGNLHKMFVEQLKEEINSIKVIPRIIIFEKNLRDFLKNSFEYTKLLDESFENFGGIKSDFEEIKNFVLESLKIRNKNEEGNLIFEYIKSKEQLYYPILYKSLIDATSIDNIDKFIEWCYTKYEDNRQISNLLRPIQNIKNIPIELLSKYFAKLYTAESNNYENNFYANINKELRENNKKEDTREKNLAFIKILYEGIRTKSLLIAKNKKLYRGTRLSNEEINQIKNSLKNKIEGLPGVIVFSKTFLSFSKEEKIAQRFLYKQRNNKELTKVLFILEKDDNIDYDLSTHVDIEDISFYSVEKEVLFLPFSSFEIKEITEEINNNEKMYKIKLLYLGKYIKELKNNINSNKIGKSEFKNQILEFGLIDKNEKNEDPEYILDKYKRYRDKVADNYIINQIEIKEKDLNKDIRIINSYDQFYRENNWGIGESNENEIKNNIVIEIDYYRIRFSYFHRFKEEGKYLIKYRFKNSLKNINYMFHGCECIINTDLSKFNSKNITNMRDLFHRCKSLKYINFSNFNTENVKDMRFMFSECESLKNIDLSNFNTKNVEDMRFMFDGCKSLTNIDLSNFNTEKVSNMMSIFYRCESLTNINLSNFNTENVINMGGMFYGCKSLINIDLSNFNNNNVNNMKYMFYGCKSLKNINLTNFETKKNINMSFMFKGCKSLNKKNVITSNENIIEEINQISK